MKKKSWKDIALEFFNYNRGKNNELYVVEGGRCIETEWQWDFVAMCTEISEIVNINVSEEARAINWKDIAKEFFSDNKVQDVIPHIKEDYKWQLNFVKMCKRVNNATV